MSASRRAPRAAFIVAPLLMAALGTGCLLYYAASDPLDSASTNADSEAGACLPSEKLCVGACVAQNDPAVGCSGDCTACEAPQNAQPACVLEGNRYLCVQGSCGGQTADCDHDAANGCETDTTQTANCGACGNDCQDAGFLYCSSGSTGYECTNTCVGGDFCGDASCNRDAGGPTCECAHFGTDQDNCGSCGHSCAFSGNGFGFCDAGQCETVCNAGRCLNDKGNCPITDLTKSPNCGACGVTCTAFQQCCLHSGVWSCVASTGAPDSASPPGGNGVCNPN